MTQAKDRATDKEVVAWEVVIDDMTAIVFATTAPKARWIAVRGYWEAGYGRGRGNWPSGVRARRCERHDNNPLRDKGPKCWTPSHAEDMRIIGA